jgi:5-methylcytosine-specific restriction endonuclease McrBC regulatory subunit McrC
VYKGKSRGFNFIVNMNKVYEEFITEIIEELINTCPEFNEFEIEKQPKFDKLVEEKSIITKPDIVLRQNRNELASSRASSIIS